MAFGLPCVSVGTDLKTVGSAFDVLAIACLSVILIRIAVKHSRQEPTTSIGRLVEHLVMVQGA